MVGFSGISVPSSWVFNRLLGLKCCHSFKRALDRHANFSRRVRFFRFTLWFVSEPNSPYVLLNSVVKNIEVIYMALLRDACDVTLTYLVSSCRDPMKVITEGDVQAPVTPLSARFWETEDLKEKLRSCIQESVVGGADVTWARHVLVGSPVMPTATGSAGHSGAIPNNEECGIKDVWAHNLKEEFRAIRQVIHKYNYVAMDTEFPGVVARPIGEFRSTADYQYQLLRCNVDLLRIIQLGLTFLDENGKPPAGPYTTWQFNFKFNLSEDMYAQDSIDLLQNSGIQFKKHEEEGIDPLEFAELLMTSGIVLMENIKWLSFHSGYDFGYLLKLLTDQNLPNDETEFFELLKLYFPTVYDVKYLMKSCKNLKGGLQEVADQLELTRVGPQHQAGSDSLLTGMAFFKMREMFFEDNIDDAKYCGHLYGLGTSFVTNGNNFHDNGDNSSTS